MGLWSKGVVASLRVVGGFGGVWEEVEKWEGERKAELKTGSEPDWLDGGLYEITEILSARYTAESGKK